jgi:hypothetical protein
MKRIIYKNDDNSISILTPAPECPLTIEEIAAKDVPTGKKYKIIEETELPTDRTFRNAWEIEESELTDGVGQ